MTWDKFPGRVYVSSQVSVRGFPSLDLLRRYMPTIRHIGRYRNIAHGVCRSLPTNRPILWLKTVYHGNRMLMPWVQANGAHERRTARPGVLYFSPQRCRQQNRPRVRPEREFRPFCPSTMLVRYFFNKPAPWAQNRWPPASLPNHTVNYWHIRFFSGSRFQSAIVAA